MPVTDHSWLLKMVPLESLGTVFYSHFIVTMAICSRFNTTHKRDRHRTDTAW